MHSDANDLQRALDEGEFFPVFQPIVELRTGQLTGFELLARWQDPARGVVQPGEFIPQIEAWGLSNRLTGALLEKAFASAALKASALRLAVNLSPVQLQNPELPALIAGCAERGGFALNRLTLEVTESALLQDPEHAREIALELKRLECRLSLDDFGTGYSSLRHLEALPFDELKVDNSFVRSMTEVRESRKIVAAVVGLGQSLGLKTVAEGVETAAQASMLMWLGCDAGQGWLYGKPAPAEEIQPMQAAAAKTFAPTMPPADGSPIMGLESLPAQRVAQIQAIYDGLPVGLCFLDRKMRFVSLNRRLADMNGAPVMAHLGKTVEEVIPHLFPPIEPFIRRALGGEPVLGVEVQQAGPEQGCEAKTVLLCYQPARDEAGEVLGVSVAVMDITEHKRTENALRESVGHFQHLLELGPHVPWVLNGQGEVVAASPRWEVLTGQRLEQALGNGWQEMLHPEDLGPTLKSIRASLEAGHSIDVYYRIRSVRGGWILMRSRGAPRFGAAGNVIGVYGMVEEVSPHNESPDPR